MAEPSPQPARHRIVVVGGGAGGLELVTRLGDTLGKRNRAEVTLVESARSHVWKPLLHEIAAGTMNIDRHDINYLAQAAAHHFRFRYGAMVGLDRAAKEVLLGEVRDEEGRQVAPARRIPYDTLVIAIGSRTNDFGTKGAAEHAYALDTPTEAARFNRRLINAFLLAQTQEGPVRQGQLHVAIIGAGATGTELSAELHHTALQLVAYGLDRISVERDLRITLIEAAPRILPALPTRISAETHKLLTELSVDVRTNARVVEVRADGVALADGGFVPAELTVWAAGVKGPDILRDLDGLESSRNNQLVAEPTLQTSRDPDIFALGDCAYVPYPGHDGPVPPRAQAAHQQASFMLKQIRRRLAGQPLGEFRYRDFGSLVSLGEYSTVGNLMGFISGRSMFIEGLFARLMYLSLYKMHEIALHGYWRVILDSLSRALSKRTGPTIKLH